MLSDFLVPDQTVTAEGAGPVFPLDNADAEIQLTLGITEVLEHQNLDLEVWGSEDGSHWGAEPLLCFPQKSTRGVWAMLLDLDRAPNIRFLQARWRVNRWGGLEASFQFYVFAEGLKGAA